MACHKRIIQTCVSDVPNATRSFARRFRVDSGFRATTTPAKIGCGERKRPAETAATSSSCTTTERAFASREARTEPRLSRLGSLFLYARRFPRPPDDLLEHQVNFYSRRLIAQADSPQSVQSTRRPGFPSRTRENGERPPDSA